MNARFIYLFLIPLAFVNVLFYYLWVYLTESEPGFAQLVLVQVFVNFIVAGYIIGQIKRDNFY